LHRICFKCPHLHTKVKNDGDPIVEGVRALAKANEEDIPTKLE
jgi:hypothetical protein